MKSKPKPTTNLGTVHASLSKTVVHKTAENSSDNFPS